MSFSLLVLVFSTNEDKAKQESMMLILTFVLKTRYLDMHFFYYEMIRTSILR